MKKKYLTTIRDVNGSEYLVVKYSEQELIKELKLFRNNIEDFDILEHNRFNRDGEYYHITVIDANTYKKISLLNKMKIDDIKFLGVGYGICKDEINETYFIIVESEQLNDIRKAFSLKLINFHITIGFNKKDVFGIDKGIISKIL